MKSWVESANAEDTDFPLENLPYGVFAYGQKTHIGVAIGAQILDLYLCAEQGLLSALPTDAVAACRTESLNKLMGLGTEVWTLPRRQLTELLIDSADNLEQKRVKPLLIPAREVEMRMPAQIGDYTDFYASVHHATRVGKLFRPDNPLLPNYKYIPIGYHGRASSIVISGTDIQRPRGQTKAPSTAEPIFGPSQSLDYELEVGMFIGPGNSLGRSIPIAQAERHIFGLCLLNDWSARDIQSWEYQPLGPFLAKSFATTISPWVVSMEALAPYRVPAAQRPSGDPAALEYLSLPDPAKAGFDITVEVFLQTKRMCDAGIARVQLSKANLRDLYWTLAQLVTHHTSNGCNLRAADLLATGTISGPEQGSEGCLLEMKHREEPLRLPTGEVRTFLDDGDEVTLRGYCQAPGLPQIGFGECSGRIISCAGK
jgi:fumarylacetoacetase